VLTARSADRLKAAAADLPGPTTAIPADVTDPAAAETVVGGVLAEHGRIDVLVANAGIYVQGNVWENDPEDMAGSSRRTSPACSGSSARCSRRCGTRPRRRRGDQLGVGAPGHPWEPVYSASKHASRRSSTACAGS
jgi:NADP-dependent 3-hydroxy acid dehydrogenase YdfG